MTIMNKYYLRFKNYMNYDPIEISLDYEFKKGDKLSMQVRANDETVQEKSFIVDSAVNSNLESRTTLIIKEI